MKNSVVIIERDQIKIVFGDKIKTIPFAEINKDYNQEFLDVIFYNTNVVKVDKISKMSRDQVDALGDKDPAPPLRTVSQPSSRASAAGPKPVGDPITAPPRAEGPQGFIPQDGGDIYIVSTSDMTIILDDLYTSNIIMRGGANVKESLTLKPGRPVNLSTLDQDSVKKSRTLRRMLRNGTIRQVSFDEASEMFRRFEENEEKQRFSVHDLPGGGMVAASEGSSEVDKMLNNMYSESKVRDTIEISEKDLVRGNEYASNEDSLSMSELMRQLDQAESDGSIAPPKRR